MKKILSLLLLLFNNLSFSQTELKICAILAHPDDELNFLGELNKYKIDVYYLTKGEDGYNHSFYYKKTDKSNIKNIRFKETKNLSKHFKFKFKMFNLPDIKNQNQVDWPQNELDNIMVKITKKYDLVYGIGDLEREHHQHRQIAKWLIKNKINTIFGNYSFIDNGNTIKYNKHDLFFYIYTLKSQSTLLKAYDLYGYDLDLKFSSIK